MALTRDRNTPQKSGELLVIPVEAGKVIYAGALVAVNAAGNAIPAEAAAGLKAAGRSEEYVDNSSGAAGAKAVTVRRGVFKFANSATDPVGQANLLGTCYMVDDGTVAATDGTGTRSAAGKVLGIDPDGVWVEIR